MYRLRTREIPTYGVVLAHETIESQVSELDLLDGVRLETVRGAGPGRSTPMARSLAP